MFELLIAFKYLIPRRRQLSVSIITLISILVISLVVWLVVVFFSVTEGLQKNWIDKLVTLTAPVRITPTESYYNSYYHRIDGLSAASDYTLKSIGEKRLVPITNPYNNQVDEEVPQYWPTPDVDSNGNLKDLVKEAFDAVDTIVDAQASDYEMAVSNIKLRLIRGSAENESQTFLSQASYLASFDPKNASMQKALVTMTTDDLTNALRLSSISASRSREDGADPMTAANIDLVHERLHAFFENIDVKALKTTHWPWPLPSKLLPSLASWRGFAVIRNGQIHSIVIPQERSQLKQVQRALEMKGDDIRMGTLSLNPERRTFTVDGSKPEWFSPRIRLFVAPAIKMSARLIDGSIDDAETLDKVRFEVGLEIQGTKLRGQLPVKKLTLAKAQPRMRFSAPPKRSPPWFHAIATGAEQFECSLPYDPTIGEGVLLAKNFRDNGVMLGDRGYLSYYTPTTSSVQEQRIPIFVAGFYDPGIIPIGGKFITVDRRVTSLIRSTQDSGAANDSNGINVRFNDLSRTTNIKAALMKEFRERGIDKYWKIETFREFDFTRDIIQQLQSEKNLFTLISIIIILVACSNIISMLIILVNDKRLEIGILRSMGAPARSIALIFGLCGTVMGILGSLIGTVAAVVTLHNLHKLLDVIAAIQGHDLFNSAFYGDMIPKELSFHALIFVLVVTIVLSLFAGTIPAVKACMMRPADILKKDN